MSNSDEYITGHKFSGLDDQHCGYVVQGDEFQNTVMCDEPRSLHADPGIPVHLLQQYPHEFVKSPEGGDHCAYHLKPPKEARTVAPGRVCGYPESEHHAARPPAPLGAVVRMADVAQYAREPMPDRARAGITVTLIDEPTDPLGTLAVIAGMYEGKVRRSKSEVSDAERRQAYADMLATVLDGPLEAVHFTFLVEGCDRAFTHQAVRNRFSFFAQESLRFAVAEDWAQEVSLPPALAGRKDDDPVVMVWRRSLNQAEDNYAALVGAGMPAEEARGVLPHAITTRYYWVVSLRTLLQEAGKRTCTQAQFHWRQMFAGVAKAFRERALEWHTYDWATPDKQSFGNGQPDGWQYALFAEAIRPVCYQQGKCGFMAKFDRGCTIRARVDAFERNGIPSERWDTTGQWDVAGVVPGTDPGGINPLLPILPAEWAADPSAARVKE